jgi:drug/metabolite transporter (DMT)-like permease
MHVSSSCRLITTILSEIRYCAKIDNPILGPPGVRLLLLFRGFSGCALNSSFFSFDGYQFGSRFIGIFGVYYALQYLSLSDSIVLSFILPLSTAMAGSLVLNEKFTKGEALAAS